MIKFTTQYKGRRKIVMIDHEGNIIKPAPGNTLWHLLAQSVIAFERHAHESHWRLLKYRYRGGDAPWLDLHDVLKDVEFTDEDVAMIRLGAEAHPIVKQRFLEYQEKPREQPEPEWIG